MTDMIDHTRTERALAAWKAGGAIERRERMRRACDAARVNAWLERFNAARTE